LLSYTLPESEKSMYALEQAIKINPDFDKAKERLKKLKARPKKSVVQEAPPKDAFTNKWDVNSKTGELPQLETTPEDLNEPKDEDKLTSPFYDSTFIDGDDDEASDEDKKGQKRGFSRFRKPLLVALLIVAILAALLYFGQLIIPNISSDVTPGLEASSTLSQGFRTLPPTWTPSP